jgi:L-amino acid N-acyltransferase YncA
MPVAFRPRAAYRFIVEDSIYVAPEAKGQGHRPGMLMQHLIDGMEEARLSPDHRGDRRRPCRQRLGAAA